MRREQVLEVLVRVEWVYHVVGQLNDVAGPLTEEWLALVRDVGVGLAVVPGLPHVLNRGAGGAVVALLGVLVS